MAIEKLYTEKEAAALLQVSPHTLRTWRSRPTSRGPGFTKIGGRVRYPESELRKCIERGRK